MQEDTPEAEFLCQKCHIRVRYNYFVDPDPDGMATNPNMSQNVKPKPTALPIPPRVGHQGRKGAKTPKYNAAHSVRTPKAAGSPRNDDSPFGFSNAEKADKPEPAKPEPSPEDPEALEKIYLMTRDVIGDQSATTIHIKARWEAALRARDNPKPKKASPIEKQIMVTKKKVEKAEAVVKEASEDIRRREKLMDDKKRELAEAAAHIEEAYQSKAQAEKLLAMPNRRRTMSG